MSIFSKLLAIFTLICLSISMAIAASNNDIATNLINSVTGDTLAVIKSNLNKNAKEQKLENLFVNNVDIDWIGRFVIGKYWRQLDDKSKQDYNKVFRKYLIKQYIPKFEAYNNNKITIIKSIKDERGFIVYTSILTKDNKNVLVNYKLHQAKDGKLKVYDVIAEGISLLNTHRSDFAAMLSKETLDIFFYILIDRLVKSAAFKK